MAARQLIIFLCGTLALVVPCYVGIRSNHKTHGGPAVTTVDTLEHSSQTPSTKSNVSTIGRGEVKAHGCKALGCRSSRDQAVPQFTDDREDDTYSWIASLALRP